MQREIRRILERTLPAECLDYLNTQFREKEEMIQKVKEYEKKVDWLLDEMAKKDAMMWQLFTGKVKELQSIGSYPVESDYSMSQPFGYKKYNPYQPYFETEMRRGRGTKSEVESRRGSPSSEIEYRRDTRSETTQEVPDIRMPHEENDRKYNPNVYRRGDGTQD